MKLRERARVKDEGTANAPYFIEIEREHGSTSAGNVRFAHRANADRVANAINKAYETEGRLWDGNRERECTCR